MNGSSQSSDIIVREKWQIIRAIGKGNLCSIYVTLLFFTFLIECIGSFSEIFLAQRVHSSVDLVNHVAIKIQDPKFESSVIKWEADVLLSLSGLQCVPNFMEYGFQDNLGAFLVMELLSGEDMATIRNRVRSHLAALSGTSKVGQPMNASLVIHFGKEILHCLQAIHSRGYVHRDVKPSNFVRRSHSSTSFSIIDFGITKQVRLQ
jgi:serine/threonine protein kinase